MLLLFAITDISRLMQDLAIVASFSEYAIPKIKMLCNLRCVKVRLRLQCIKNKRQNSSNLVSRTAKLCNLFVSGMAY